MKVLPMAALLQIKTKFEIKTITNVGAGARRSFHARIREKIVPFWGEKVPEKNVSLYQELILNSLDYPKAKKMVRKKVNFVAIFDKFF